MVDAIHTAMASATEPLASNDQVAYSALASAKGKIMTWFNQAVKLGIDCLVASDGYTLYGYGHTPDLRHDHFRPWLTIYDDGVTQVADGKFYLGTSKTNLIHAKTATIVAGVSASFAPPDGYDFLTAGVKYYWQFRPDTADPCEGANSGIYHAVAT